MTNDDGRKPEGAPERCPKAGVGAPSGVDGNGPKRFSVQRKIAIVARLLRGEPLELDPPTLTDGAETFVFGNDRRALERCDRKPAQLAIANDSTALCVTSCATMIWASPSTAAWAL